MPPAPFSPYRRVVSALRPNLLAASSAALAFMYSSNDGAAEIDWRGSDSFTNGSRSRVSYMPPAPFSPYRRVASALRPNLLAASSAALAFMYSSNDGAAEIDWRGSDSFTNGSGSRVSYMPPAPFSPYRRVASALRPNLLA